MTSEAAALTEQIAELPTEPGSVIEAKPPGRKKAFRMALCDDGEWWVRLDNYGSFSERGPFREVRVLFDAGAARLADSRPVVSEAAIEAAWTQWWYEAWPHGTERKAEKAFKAGAKWAAPLPHMCDGKGEAEVAAKALEDAADDYEGGGILPGYPDRHFVGGWLRDRAASLRLSPTGDE